MNKIYEGDALETLKRFHDKIANCIVTSPPYYGLRDYGVTGQCGLEKSPEEYIQNQVLIFREAKRVLRDDGTLWLNIGDSYASGPRDRTPLQACANSTISGAMSTQMQSLKQINKITDGLKSKDLIGIPWMLAFALRADGWYLRQDIIWQKPNPMPESVSDRCTKSHEYIFLLSKSPKYYYDAEAIATPYQDKTLTTFGCESKGKGDGSGLIKSENWGNSIEVRKPKVWKTPDGWDTAKGSHGIVHRDGRSAGKTAKEKNAEAYGINGHGFKGHSGNYDAKGNLLGSGKANKRSVWTVATMPYSEAHFATFPEKLITDCIKAGCPDGGIVLDVFMGAGTTALVARKLNRNFIGIELNPAYIKLAEKRLQEELGLFA